MQIGQILDVLNVEYVLGKTPKGNWLTDFDKESLLAVISDQSNYNAEACQCENCGFVISVLLTDKGCPHCGHLAMSTNINPNDLKIH